MSGNKSQVEMHKKSVEKYHIETYYQAYYQEIASEMLIKRWQQIDVMIAFLIAATASVSTMAGWALWSEPSLKFGWAVISGSVSLASIAHGILGVSGRIKEQEELRRNFRKLRINIETFRHQMKIGLSADQADVIFEKLREGYTQCMESTRPDIVFSKGFSVKVQETLNERLTEKMNIHE